jgi:hypothetical protein
MNLHDSGDAELELDEAVSSSKSSDREGDNKSKAKKRSKRIDKVREGGFNSSNGEDDVAENESIESISVEISGAGQLSTRKEKSHDEPPQALLHRAVSPILLSKKRGAKGRSDIPGNELWDSNVVMDAVLNRTGEDENVQNRSRPRRKSAGRVVSLKEPSLRIKVRKGHQFFHESAI